MNDAILAGYNPAGLVLFDRQGGPGALPGTPDALNLDLGTTNLLHDPLGGPAFSTHGGVGLLPDASDLWNGVAHSDLQAGMLVYADGRGAPGVSLNVGRENGLGTKTIDWNMHDLVSRTGSTSEGLQSNGAGGFASEVIRTYERESSVDLPDTIRCPGFAIENLPAGTYAVFIVADNTYHTAALGTNRQYNIYAGVADTMAGPTHYAGFTRKTITNTDWSAWQPGVNYVRYDLTVAEGQDIIVVSQETADLAEHSLINCIQVVPFEPSGRIGLVGDLGEMTANAAGQIDLYVDDAPAGQRSSYDGISYLYRPAEPPPTWTVLNTNGAWCWYQDERLLIDGDKLIFGSVADAAGTDGATRDGNIEVTTYDIPAGGPPVVNVLHPNLQADDHDLPAFLLLPEGRYLAAYSKHSSDAIMRFRISTAPGDSTAWDPEFTHTRPIRVCYNNLFRLAAENGGSGRIYDFYRGEGFDPNFVISDDNGRTWSYGGRLLYNATNDDGTRPYLKYASNDVDTIHFVSTDGHPESFVGTSIYHGFIRDMKVYHSDGTLIADLRSGPIEAATPTRVFTGSAAAEAWTADLHLNAADRPYLGYTVHLSDDDHRYRYARWDGMQWHDYEIAYAGTRLYVGQNHYTGLIALDPQNPNRVFISANADPVTGAPLVSLVDGRRHWEIFRGVTADGGATWAWTPITHDSTVDNLRPSVPIATGRYSALVWMRGTYTSYTNYDLDMVGQFFVAADFDMDSDVDPDDLDAFRACAAGANVSYGPGQLPPGCNLPLNRAGRLPADFDADMDVDQDDFGVFQRCISGPGNSPDPACMK